MGRVRPPTTPHTRDDAGEIRGRYRGDIGGAPLPSVMRGGGELGHVVLGRG